MSTELIERGFQKMGARVKVIQNHHGLLARRLTPDSGVRRPATFDVGNDKKGEHFIIRVDDLKQLEDLQILQIDPEDRHLLLMNREGGKSKFLCGHDERHWFVAAVPESSGGVTNVTKAKEALQPDSIRQATTKVRPKDRLKRRNEAFKRQGEWFFTPLPPDVQPEGLVFKNEPITRGRGKPHIVEFVIRNGGTAVMDLGGGKTMSMEQWGRMSHDERRKTRGIQRTVVGRLFAKGAVRHPDHATLYLDDWHEVEMNTEQRSRAMSSVAFMD